MKKEDFAYIGCRLLALYLAVMATYSASSFAAVFAVVWEGSMGEFSPGKVGAIYFNLVPLVLYALAALIFWFGAARLVKYLLPVKSVHSESSTITLFEAQSVAFAAVGALLLFNAIPDISGVLYKFQLMKEMDSYTELLFDMKTRVFQLSIQLVLGMLLLLGSKGLSGMLIRIRELGMK